jgi:hypothetical protein
MLGLVCGVAWVIGCGDDEPSGTGFTGPAMTMSGATTPPPPGTSSGDEPTTTSGAEATGTTGPGET